MSPKPVPMNRKQRREQKVKTAPETMPFMLVLAKRIEREDEDGVVYAQSFFRVVTQGGATAFDDSMDGKVPLIIATVPIPVRQNLLARATPAQKLLLS